MNLALKCLNQAWITSVPPFCFAQCVIPENIHTSPMEGIFSRTPSPLWKFQLSFIHFFKFFGLTEPPTSREIPIPSVGGVWIFPGTAQFHKHTWNYQFWLPIVSEFLKCNYKQSCCFWKYPLKIISTAFSTVNPTAYAVFQPENFTWGPKWPLKTFFRGQFFRKGANR